MKTFDIAIEYLKDIDFSKFNTYDGSLSVTSEEDEITAQLIKEQQEKYLSDSDNTYSNDYYRNIVFAACLCHLSDLAYNRASFWNVACEIIEANRDILKTKFEGFTNGSSYPKLMMDEFVKYCNEMSPQPSFLSNESEVRTEFFMAAFHYITDAKS